MQINVLLNNHQVINALLYYTRQCYLLTKFYIFYFIMFKANMI